MQAAENEKEMTFKIVFGGILLCAVVLRIYNAAVRRKPRDAYNAYARSSMSLTTLSYRYINKMSDGDAPKDTADGIPDVGKTLVGGALAACVVPGVDYWSTASFSSAMTWFGLILALVALQLVWVLFARLKLRKQEGKGGGGQRH